jgi:hypothetical protein
MTQQRTLQLIEAVWDGPYTQAQLAALGAAHDRGLIVIYGSHPVFGDDALLYIDEARAASFAERILRIDRWLKLLPSEPTFYVGRLGGDKPVSDAEWTDMIEAAHRLLVFFHAPPWNSHGIDHHRVNQPTVVINLGRRHRLALEVSTLWDQSAWDPERADWRPYGVEGDQPTVRETHSPDSQE